MKAARVADLVAVNRAMSRQRLVPRHAVQVRQAPCVGIARGFRKPGDPPIKPAEGKQVVHTTRRMPWDVKAERRNANRIARASRHRNRH